MLARVELSGYLNCQNGDFRLWEGRFLLRKIALLFVSVACLISPALAKHDKKPLDPNKKTCRRIVETGTIMGDSVCHTNAEWQQIDAANADNAHKTLDQRAYRPPE
jgi:hypothetical protein